MTDYDYLTVNYTNLRENIQSIADRCGRKSDEIRIVAVSKTFSAETMQAAIDQGITLFGENKVQEAREKLPRLHGNFSCHMIGHLQTNKIRQAFPLFSCIESIDSIHTAERLNDEAMGHGSTIEILIQVNSSGEEQKSGVRAEELIDLAGKICELKGLRPQGLMTMARETENTREIHRSFSLTRELLEKCNRELSLDMKELSMGMSMDYLIAVEEGATLLRIGSALFGKR